MSSAATADITPVDPPSPSPLAPPTPGPASSPSIYSRIESMFPILQWLPQYRLQYLYRDIMAGITIAALIVPQGMAYAVMANLPPVYGLYASIFPSLIYLFVGTTIFMSIGPFAVVSLMVGDVGVKGYEIVQAMRNSTVASAELAQPPALSDSPVLVSVILFQAFAIGVGLVLLSFVQAGKFLSKHMVSLPMLAGFSAATSLIIITSQLRQAFGLVFPKQSGIFSLPMTWWQIIINSQTFDPATSLVFAASVALMLGISTSESAFRKWLASRPAQRTHQSVPTDPEQPKNPRANATSSSSPVAQNAIPDVLVTVLAFIVLSIAMKLSTDYGIDVVGPIPAGFPAPRVPWDSLSFAECMAILGGCSVDLVALSLVAFVTTFSISTTFGRHRATKPLIVDPIPVSPSSRSPAPSSSPMIAATQLPSDPTPTIANVHKAITRASLAVPARYGTVHVPGDRQTPRQSETSLLLTDGEDAVQPNQELFALGLVALLAAFASCYLPSGSLSRSAVVANRTEAQSLVAGLVCVSIVMVVVNFLTAWFEALPMAVLSSVTIVALWKVVLTIAHVKTLWYKGWKKSKSLSQDWTLADSQSMAVMRQSPSEMDILVASKRSPTNLHGNFDLSNRVSSDGSRNSDEIEEGVASLRPTHFRMTVHRALTFAYAYRDAVVWTMTFVSVAVFDARIGIVAGIVIVSAYKLISYFEARTRPH
ncbi:sulfate transporter N-terminal domain with GLY motif-domain-containing protein [Polychytrium aggregatum]|uniref:sulfate transporter N-terminal domain with GLY motif-domain-containing protein n=1 Tax=Polychytrium aggregatum TaxID=110093 RepID=UPI0022FF0644|nr:sulfate transporter N-terminal domain with GLY motif-domain-containing protein [Polychytrium aggregatum]KAI9206425.1 sulfate transporter N-terminal domain with GLY motif-domain-containing protein [Polychytrium aggregatum]